MQANLQRTKLLRCKYHECIYNNIWQLLSLIIITRLVWFYKRYCMCSCCSLRAQWVPASRICLGGWVVGWYPLTPDQQSGFCGNCMILFKWSTFSYHSKNIFFLFLLFREKIGFHILIKILILHTKGKLIIRKIWRIQAGAELGQAQYKIC